MSIALGVQWPDGRYAVGPGTSQAGARRWASEAPELGLPMLSQIDMNGWPMFGPNELEAIICEFKSLREHLVHKCEDSEALIDPGIAALSALWGLSNWDGDFG